MTAGNENGISVLYNDDYYYLINFIINIKTVWKISKVFHIQKIAVKQSLNFSRKVNFEDL